ncbi:MAG TPA: hypothetical protein VFW96_14140 [Thermomicrobiales bacterium]|nr:hypothetical protein [Thermomicrobiales bacterium]
MAHETHGERRDEEHPMVQTVVDGTQVLVGIFPDMAGVSRAVNRLRAGGFDRREISILAKDGLDPATSDRILGQAKQLNSGDNLLTEPEAQHMEGQYEADKVTEANEGTGVGISTGAAVGAALGLAAFAVPGIGPILAAGPVVMALSGAGIGGSAGGWIGSITGLGIARGDAGRYVSYLDEGHWLVAVQTNRVDETLALMHDAGALNV